MHVDHLNMLLMQYLKMVSLFFLPRPKSSVASVYRTYTGSMHWGALMTQAHCSYPVPNSDQGVLQYHEYALHFGLGWYE